MEVARQRLEIVHVLRLISRKDILSVLLMRASNKSHERRTLLVKVALRMLPRDSPAKYSAYPWMAI